MKPLKSTGLLLILFSIQFVYTDPLYSTTSRELIQGTRILSRLWRDASLPEHRTSPQDVIRYYKKIIDTSTYLQSPFKTWYLGVTNFGLARAYARIGDGLHARKFLQEALVNQFWNVDVMMADPLLRKSVGSGYLDSISKALSRRRSREESTWREQVLIVHGPNERREWAMRGNTEAWFTNDSLRGYTFDSIYKARWKELVNVSRMSSKKPAVIIALHGGNASHREFGSRWFMIGDITNSYVVIPPGITRHSNTLNGWESEYGEMDAWLMRTIEALRDERGELPPIYLAGFSQGACLAIKFGLVNSEIVKGVVSISGFMDSDIELELAQHAAANGVKIYALSGEHDSEEFKRSLLIAKDSLEAGGIAFKFVEKEKMIHELPENLGEHFAAAWEWISR